MKIPEKRMMGAPEVLQLTANLIKSIRAQKVTSDKTDVSPQFWNGTVLSSEAKLYPKNYCSISIHWIHQWLIFLKIPLQYSMNTKKSIYWYLFTYVSTIQKRYVHYATYSYIPSMNHFSVISLNPVRHDSCCLRYLKLNKVRINRDCFVPCFDPLTEDKRSASAQSKPIFSHRITHA